MHRVDTKKTRATTLRVIAYIVTITLTILTTTLLLYIALGYRFDSGHVVRSGLLLVDNRPEAGSIYINNEIKDNSAPGRFVLTAGSYDLKIARQGYRDWEKTVDVKASGVREVRYPLLIPNTLQAQELKSFSKPYLISQSPDKKRLLMHSDGQATLTLLTLKPETVEEEALILSSSIPREAGKYGSFSVIEWALDNKHVLLQQTLPSGLIQLLSLDITKPSEVRNISQVYGNETPDDVHYVGNNTDKIYGLKNTILSVYSTEKKESEQLLENIRSYQPYANDTILFDRATAAGTAEVGIWKDTESTVVHSNVEGSLPSILRLAEYDDHSYFIVAPLDGSTVTIYRDPLQKPVLAKQLPFAQLSFSGTKNVDFSDSAQFLLIQNETQLLTYDFEDVKQYPIALPFALESGSKVNWSSAHHLQLKNSEGTSFLMDYDGTNMQELVRAQPGSRLYFSSNFEYAYQFIDAEGESKLQSVSFVIKAD